MNGKVSNTMIGGLLAGITVLAASCGAGSGVAEIPADTANAGNTATPEMIEQAITTDGLPSLDKSSSDWQQWGGIGDMIDWYTVWLGLHQSVHHGLNQLDETKLIAKSEGVYNFEEDGKDFLNFPATPNGEISYAVFGLKNIPEGEIIRGIHFTTDFNSSESPIAEYYVSFSNFESGNYQWYGPYHEGDIELYNLFTDTVNENNRAYFTIAVNNNIHWSDVSDVEVVIGNPVVIDLPILYERNPIPNWWLLDEDGFVDWSRFFELPAVQDLGMLKIMPELNFRSR